MGLAMWGPGLTWLTAGMGTLMFVQRFFSSQQIDPLTRVYTRGQIVASGSRLRFEVSPAIDPNRQYMFVQNHVNLLDHCTCYNATPHFKQGVELAEHFNIPVYGWFMRQRGTIAVHRDGSPKETLKKLTADCEAAVAKGQSLLVFPEGTRTLDGRVSDFRAGMFRIAHKLQLPIVPTAVTGMFEVLRKGAPYINPGHKVTVYMDDPIETSDVGKREIPELIERTRAVIARRVDAFYDGEPGLAESDTEADAPRTEPELG